jgi:hypothetical protein
MTSPHELPRFARVFNVRQQRSRCERCRALWKSPHRHLLDLNGFQLLCACASCTAACLEDARGSCRVVPAWVRKVLGWSPERSRWSELELPGIAFFLRASRVDGWLAIYPSAIGALDGHLSVADLTSLLGNSVVLARVALDVEALLIDARSAEQTSSYIVPIDVCFDLSALVRQIWPGIDGGEAARRELDRFFAALEQRAVPLRPLHRVTARAGDLPPADAELEHPAAQ